MRLDDYVVLHTYPVKGDHIIAATISGGMFHPDVCIVHEVTENSIRVLTEDGELTGFLWLYTTIRVVHHLTVPQLAEHVNTLSDL